MEIVFNNVGYKDKLNNVNLKISNEGIVGIYGKYKDIFIDMLSGNIFPLVGTATVNNVEVIENNKDNLKRQVAYIRNCGSDNFKTDMVLTEIGYIVDTKNYKNNSLNKKIKDAFSLVGLDDSYLTRSFSTLSSSEIYLVQIAMEFICNPKIILFESPFVNLDYHNKKRLLKLLKLLKEKYHKMVFICDNNVDVLYQYTDNILLVNDCNRINLYNSYDFFTSIKFLSANDIEIPRAISIIYEGKMRGAKLTYQKDIRDIIKDIYKHV